MLRAPRALAALVVRVVLERQLRQHVPGAVVPRLVSAADPEVRREGLAELTHEAEVARVVGEAVLGLGEAGVIVDEAAAVGVGGQEEADGLGEGTGLGVLAHGDVGDGRLLEVGDRGVLGVEDAGPGRVDGCGGEERIDWPGPVGRFGRVSFRRGHCGCL